MIVTLNTDAEYYAIKEVITKDCSYDKRSKKLTLKGNETTVLENKNRIVEFIKYRKRQIDGENFSYAISSKILLDYDSNLTLEENNAKKMEIDEALSPVQTVITQGKWISGQRKIAQVSITQNVTAELIEEIKLVIDSYVQENYNLP